MPGLPITAADVSAAADRIRGAVVRTPSAASHTLSAITGAEIVVKFENLQFTASYKERGALNRLLTLSDEQRACGVVAMSAGNHAQALAHHAARLGIAATIVMPKGTPNTKVSRTAALGARVVLEGADLAAAAEHAHALEVAEGLTFVSPFDDTAIMAGQGTVALELLDDHPDLDTIVVPVGGGGLISGIAVAAKDRRPDIHIVGVQSEQFPSMRAALDHVEPACGGPTVAEGIAVATAGVLTRQVVEALVDDVVTVRERTIEDAVCLYLEIEKVVAEGAGSAGLAAVLEDPERFAGRKVGLVITGGNIDLRFLASVIMRGLVRSGRLVRFTLEIDDQPGVLARITGLVGDLGANIIEITHQRDFSAFSAREAEVQLALETRDRAHAAEVGAALGGAGFTVLASSLD